MTADRAALVEKVARAICKEDGREPDSLDPWMGEHQHPAWEDYEDQATAAIALIRVEVLEEAARVAEREGVYPELNIYNGGPEWYRHGKRIAAAIRALKEKNNG